MTADEKTMLKQLQGMLYDLRKENEAFKSNVLLVVEKLQNKVDSKHVPISLEQDILSTVQSSMGKAIQEALTGYNSPLTKLVQEIVNAHSTELRKIIGESFEEVIRTEDFKRSIVSAFSHKVARSIIAGNDSLYDKVGNELKQDATFKAKMALAVANVVEECIKKEPENDSE